MSKPSLTDLQAENATGQDGQKIKKRITDLEVRNFTGPVGKKIKKYHVGEGLYLWCMKEGGRCWRFRYYLDGKERGMALGTYPKVSLADARKAVEKQREILQAGTDPAQERRVVDVALAEGGHDVAVGLRRVDLAVLGMEEREA